MDKLRIVLCTFPDAVSARQVARELVEKKLAACVNLIPAVESIYRWEGKTETAAEVMAVCKTSVETYPEFAAALAAAHPYEVPEIVALEPCAVADPYGEWCLENLAGSARA